MPDFNKVQAKVDNRGIDIPKWRYSMLNLRALVDPEEISQGLREAEERSRSVSQVTDLLTTPPHTQKRGYLSHAKLQSEMTLPSLLMTKY